MEAPSQTPIPTLLDSQGRERRGICPFSLQDEHPSHRGRPKGKPQGHCRVGLLVSLRLRAAPGPSDEDHSSVALWYLPCSDTITMGEECSSPSEAHLILKHSQMSVFHICRRPLCSDFTTKLKDNNIQPLCTCTSLRSGCFARSRSPPETHRFFPLASAVPSALCSPLATVVCFMPLCFLF